MSCQSSNLGLRFAISGSWRNAFLSKGLNSPEVFKLFSTIFEISDPIFFLFKIFSNSFFDTLSIERGDTATGNGFKFPLVISTSINACAFNWNKNKKIKNIFLNI